MTRKAACTLQLQSSLQIGRTIRRQDMKNRLVLLMAINFILAGLISGPSLADTIAIPVSVNGTIYSVDGAWGENALQLDYVWDQNQHRQVFLGFNLTGHLSIEKIKSINAITLNVHETHTYYTGNNVHVYTANDNSWVDGVYTYGAYGSSLGSQFYPAVGSCSTEGGCPVDNWYVYDVTAASGVLADTGMVGLYLALPTKDDGHNYAFHKLESGTANLVLDYEPNLLVDLFGGLLGWYPFDGNAEDEGPLGNDGTVSGR